MHCLPATGGRIRLKAYRKTLGETSGQHRWLGQETGHSAGAQLGDRPQRGGSVGRPATARWESDLGAG
jgi:hypothetical protein